MPADFKAGLVGFLNPTTVYSSRGSGGMGSSTFHIKTLDFESSVKVKFLQV